MWIILFTLVFAVAGCGEGKKTDANTPASGNETIADTTPPAAPTDLTATPVSSSRMDLSWTASADTDVTGYSVYRGTTKIATLTSTSYTDTGLFAAEYCYQVEAFDAAGNTSNKTPEACASTLTIADTTPPAAPTHLTATPVSSSRMELSWTASADTDVTGYSVYRETTKIATLTSTSYADTGLSADTRYCYQAEAFDAAGNTSNKTPETCSSTLPVVGTTPATLLVRVVNNDDKSPISDATVVLGDSAGAMVNSGTTDSNGEITFTDPPANATVTAALNSDNGTEILYSLKTLYDVNISEVTINLVKAVNAGMVNVKVTNTKGADYWEVYGGSESVEGDDANNPVTVNIGQSNIQNGGMVSFVAVGYDAGGSPIGYGTFLDQTFTNGMTVNIDINKTDLSTIAFNMANIPESALSYDGEVEMGRNGAAYIDPFWEIVYAPIPPTVTTSAIPEYGDIFRYDARVNMADSDLHFLKIKKSTTPENQPINWGTFPAIPSSLELANAGTSRPTLSWRGSDPNADYVRLWIPYDTASSSYRYFIEVPTTRTGVVFPELPGSLASFRPTWIDSFEAGNIETDMASGYDDSLVKYGQYMSGTITEYVVKSSWKYYIAP